MPTVLVHQPKAQVFEFQMYDIRTDEFQTSSRWATREFVEKVGARMTGRTASVVAESLSTEGLTERDFNPNPRPPGFQREVR